MPISRLIKIKKRLTGLKKKSIKKIEIKKIDVINGTNVKWWKRMKH